MASKPMLRRKWAVLQAALRRQCLSVLSVQVCSSPLMSVAAIYRIARVCGEYSKRYSVVSQVKAARQNPLLPLVTVSFRCRHLPYSPRMRQIRQTVWCCNAHTPPLLRDGAALLCAQTMSDRSDKSDWSDLSAANAADTTIVDMRIPQQHGRAAADLISVSKQTNAPP